MTDLQLTLAIGLVLFTVALAEIKEEQKWEEHCLEKGKMNIFQKILFTILNVVNEIVRLVIGAMIILLPLSILFQ